MWDKVEVIEEVEFVNECGFWVWVGSIVDEPSSYIPVQTIGDYIEQ